MTDQRLVVRMVGAALVSALLAGCGGGSTSTQEGVEPPPTGGTPPPAPAPIVGVATPSSVAVVTATNAN